METITNTSDNIITNSYKEYHQVILTYITYRITHRYEAEDLAQDVFVRLLDYKLQSPNQKIPDRKTKCVIKTHINIKQNVIFGAKLKPV